MAQVVEMQVMQERWVRLRSIACAIGKVEAQRTGTAALPSLLECCDFGGSRAPTEHLAIKPARQALQRLDGRA